MIACNTHDFEEDLWTNTGDSPSLADERRMNEARFFTLFIWPALMPCCKRERHFYDPFGLFIIYWFEPHICTKNQIKLATTRMAADARGRIFTAYKMTNKNATQKLHHTAGAYIDSLTAMTHQLIGAYIHDRGHTLLSHSICNGHILPQKIFCLATSIYSSGAAMVSQRWLTGNLVIYRGREKTLSE